MSNDYSSFKVVDLKKELKTRGLSTAGNKDELVERLNTYTQNLLGSGSDIDGFGESMAENDILEEDVLEEELDYEEDELKKSSELEFPSPIESSSLDMPADVSVDSNNSALNVTVIAADDPLPQRITQRNSQKPGEKKVHLVRNRSLSLLSDSDLKENTKVDNDENQKKESSDDSSVKVSTKLTQSMEERLEQRKRKFGLLQEEDKKLARAARFGINSNSNEKNTSTLKNVTESADVLKQRAERFGLSTSSSTVGIKSNVDLLKSRAERFGAVVSPMLSKFSEEEKMLARKNRFLDSSNVTEDEKKKLRAQRFNISK